MPSSRDDRTTEDDIVKNVSESISYQISSLHSYIECLVEEAECPWRDHKIDKETHCFFCGVSETSTIHRKKS